MSEGSAGAQDRGADLTGLTMRYAEHLAALRYADIPADVIHKAKTIIRDGVGNQIAASAISEPAARMIELRARLGRRAAGHDHRLWAQGPGADGGAVQRDARPRGGAGRRAWHRPHQGWLGAGLARAGKRGAGRVQRRGRDRRHRRRLRNRDPDRQGDQSRPPPARLPHHRHRLPDRRRGDGDQDCWAAMPSRSPARSGWRPCSRPASRPSSTTPAWPSRSARAKAR